MKEMRFLVVDPDSLQGEFFANQIAKHGAQADRVESLSEAMTRLQTVAYDMVLLDISITEDRALSPVREIKRGWPAMLVVAVGRRPSVASVLSCFRSGALDFVEKPISSEDLESLVERVRSIRSKGRKRDGLRDALQNERQRVQQLQRELLRDDPLHRIVGSSHQVRRVIDTAREVARTDSTVLLTGESGTGKGLLARCIHESSTRAEAPFVEANCVVYSEGLLHSELFGHEKGAFTGADKRKRGRFEVARGGTLFLDEIGEITHKTQLLLLRVLQDRTFERLGGEETLATDVRLIAATNRDLEEAIRRKEFRADLFYRLNVIPLRVPALREHPDDIPQLAQHFLARSRARVGRDVSGFTPQAMELLMRYPWPGNVRELENTIERVVVLNRSGTIEATDIPATIHNALPGAAGVPTNLRSLERSGIVQALEQTEGNKKKAAQLLGIHRSTLYAKMRRYGLSEELWETAALTASNDSAEATRPRTRR